MSGHKSKKRGSNIICRVSNATPEMVCQYVKRLPKQIMTEKAFRDYMGKKWFQNEHQAPEQWGLYYIDGESYYPRFNRNITIKEAERYLLGWIKRLIVINPYTNFKTTNDSRLVESIVKELESNPQEHDLKTVFSNIINSDEPFIVNEIIANALNNYSEVLKVEVIDNNKEIFHVSLLPNYKEILKTKFNMTKKEYFDSFSDIDIDAPVDDSNQIIYYGAPGTGKSNTIKRKVDDKKQIRHRTTFHPDSDYSTFVGAYKPTMRSKERIYSPEELVLKLGEIKKTGDSYPCQKFATKFWESLKDLNTEQVKRILNACDFTDSMTTEISKGLAIGQDLFNKVEEGKIIYSFIPQAFTNAYIDAWNTKKPVFLLIEEINRGNCAQIFGDLFQLLDRKNGFSEYPIKADTDLANYLSVKLENSPRNDIPDFVKNGEWLMLPNNLYIWATMNTSDQSLFPIDSAFKRRWEWKYIPIKNHPDEDYKIEIGESKYDWWDFLCKINQVINTTTSSEDKKLGYFFAKAEGGVIKDEQFVGKVLFYLWNDVFKNYGFDNPIFDKADKDKLVFSDFFNADGSPNHENVKLFLKNLGLEAKEQAPDGGKGSIAVIYSGERIQLTNAKETYVEIIKKAINDKGVQQVADVIGSELTPNKQGETRRYVEITSGWYLATNIGIDKIKTNLNKLKDGLNVELEIEHIPIETEQ